MRKQIRRASGKLKKLETFREVFGRDPDSDDELESFAEEYIRELYNSGYDEP